MREPAQLVSERAGRNRKTTLWLTGLVLGMFAFGFALVPLYRIVCKATGINTIGGGGRERAVAYQTDKQGREVTVQFDATVNAGLPWTFEPLVKKMTVRTGKVYEVEYYAKNNEDRVITAQAVPGITPWQATGHFHKTECFCFSKQTLQAEEGRKMPLRFIIDPELPAQYKLITLSYMFMPVNGAVIDKVGMQ